MTTSQWLVTSHFELVVISEVILAQTIILFSKYPIIFEDMLSVKH